MAKKICLLTMIFYGIVSASAALNFPPKPNGRVGDYAQLFNEQQTLTINKKLLDIKESTGYDFVVATVMDTQETDIGDFAVQLGNEWGVGHKDTDGGILMLIDPVARKVFIATGYGAEIPLPDIRIRYIIQDHIIPEFKRGDYYAGVLAGIAESKTYLAKEELSNEGKSNRHDKSISFFSSFLIVISLAMLMVAFIMWRLKRTRFSYTYSSGYDVDSNFPVSESKEQNVQTSINKYFFHRITGFGGGGFSGGGFGGGGFGGGGFGGGGFGGGGAGGSW